MMSLEKKSLGVFNFPSFLFFVVVLGFFYLKSHLSPNNTKKRKRGKEKKKEKEALEREMCGALFRVLYFFI